MRERELHVYDTRQFSKSVGSLGFGSAPGVLSPHFDPDSKLLFLSGRGEGTIYTIDMSLEKAPFHSNLITGKVQEKEPQTSSCLAPKRSLQILDCEVNRLYRVLKSSVQIVHFHVSRVNKDIFHDDLFPPSPSSFSMSSQDFFSGNPCSPPHLASLEPK
jgi:hypothetical protein